MKTLLFLINKTCILLGVNSLTKGKKHGTLIFMKSITELQMLLDNLDYLSETGK